MAVAAAVAVEPAPYKSCDSVVLHEEAESTDVSSSEDALLSSPSSSVVTGPHRRSVLWCDLLDSRMLATENELDIDDSEGPDHQEEDAGDLVARTAQHVRETAISSKTLEADEQSVASAHSKRRARRRRRSGKVSDASPAESRLSSGLSRPSEWDNSMEYFYPHQHVPSKFDGLSTHCGSGTLLSKRAGRNVVTCNDILGQDFFASQASTPHTTCSRPSLSSSAPAFTPSPTCAIKMACPQTTIPATTTTPGAWVGSCEAGARSAWHAPLVTPWNPPYWESTVNAYDEQAGQSEPLRSFLVQYGMPSSDHAAEELQSVALNQNYED